MFCKGEHNHSPDDLLSIQEDCGRPQMFVELQIPSHISQQDLTGDEGNWRPTDDRLDKDNFGTEWNRTVFAQQLKGH